MTNTVIAFDKSSARTVDVQGFMHVQGCNISKSTVNPYMGSEVPNWREHGLSPSKVYMILRPAEELLKAAPTFNNLPLLAGHREVAADELDDPEVKKYVVGSTGTDATFDGTYLKNSLVIWTAGAIDGVTTKEQTELSCAYRYDFVPESGVYAGQAYDGRMTNIVGNHVALVEEGRAGRDVVVADAIANAVKQGIAAQFHKEARMGAKAKNRTITPQGQVVRGALLAYIRPRLAADAAIAPGEISTIVKNIAPGRYSKQVDGLVGVVAYTFKGRTAEVIAIDELNDLLTSLEGEFANDEAVLSEDAAMCKKCGKGLAADGHCADSACKMAKDADKDQDQDSDDTSTPSNETPVDKLQDKSQPSTKTTGDAMPEDIKKDEAAPIEAAAAPVVETITQTAMDAALETNRKSVIAEMGARFQAGSEVETIIGKVDVLAADSAEAIYKLALDAKGVDTTGVHPSAYRAMLKMVPAPAEAAVAPVTADAASISDFLTRYPHAAGVKKG